MFKLREYQELAADFIYSNDRSMILAPVGAGKTATAATAMRDLLRDGVVKRWLVLAPKRVCEHVWPRELPLWAPGLGFAVAVGTPAQRKAALASTAPVVITNYDNLQWLATQPLNFDGVVFDELTRLKNPSGARFKALSAVIDAMNVRVGLTGSFTSNGLEDVYGQVKIVDQQLLGRSKGAFMQQYFICMNPEYGEFMPRPGALQRVMERIKPATFVLENKEYADNLPPLNIVPLTATMNMEPYKEMKKNLVLQAQGETITAVNAAVMTGKLQQLACGWVYSTNERPDPNKPGKWIVDKTPVWLSSHKFDLLDEVLAENQRAPTIVVYNFVEELAELRRRYAHLQTLDDPDAIDRWNDGKIELLALHPMSAQFGLNLQYGGNLMVFLSLPWSLINFEQAIGRLHRSGQTNPVYVYPLLTKDTIDERMFQGLQDKKDMSQIALAELVK